MLCLSSSLDFDDITLLMRSCRLYYYGLQTGLRSLRDNTSCSVSPEVRQMGMNWRKQGPLDVRGLSGLHTVHSVQKSQQAQGDAEAPKQMIVGDAPCVCPA